MKLSSEVYHSTSRDALPSQYQWTLPAEDTAGIFRFAGGARTRRSTLSNPELNAG